MIDNYLLATKEAFSHDSATVSSNLRGAKNLKIFRGVSFGPPNFWTLLLRIGNDYKKVILISNEGLGKDFSRSIGLRTLY